LLECLFVFEHVKVEDNVEDLIVRFDIYVLLALLVDADVIHESLGSLDITDLDQ